MTCRLYVVASAMIALVTASARAQVLTLSENFDATTTELITAGWSIQNLSTVVGTNVPGWNQFTGATPWAPQASTSQIGANFNAAAGANTISAWLITPQVAFATPTTLSFWTRKADTDTFPDRLQVRLSASGASTNVGTTSAGVGDFTTLLLDINPTLVTGVYPTTYTQFTVNIPAQAGSGRLAFRYFVDNGGPSGTNSDIISIDTLAFAPVPEPGSFVLVGATVAGAGYLRKRRAARTA